MKQLRNIILVAVSVLMSSCTLSLEKANLLDEGSYVAPVLSEHSPIIADADNIKVESIVFDWSDADFGPAVQTRYSVYASYGEKTALLGQSFATSFTIAKEDFMGVVCATLGAPKNETVKISSYVEAGVYSTDVKSVKSNTITYDVTTYVAAKRSLSLPGNYQGWNIKATDFWETDGGTNIYKILVNFTKEGDTESCSFKVGQNQTTWLGSKEITPSWSCGDDAMGNFAVPASEPINIISVNMTAKTIDREVKTSVGIIGSFDESSWATDVDFVYDPATNIWATPVITFSGANTEFLVRFNKSWGDNKYGSDGALSEDVEGGIKLVQGDAANIAVPSAGSYIMKLHGNRTPFVLVMEKQ